MSLNSQIIPTKFTFTCPINNIHTSELLDNAGVGGQSYFNMNYENGCNPCNILTIDDYVTGGKIVNIQINNNNDYIINILDIPEQDVDTPTSTYMHIGTSTTSYTLDEFNRKYAKTNYDYPQYKAYESIGIEWDAGIHQRNFIDNNLALLMKNPRMCPSNSHMIVARIKYV